MRPLTAGESLYSVNLLQDVSQFATLLHWDTGLSEWPESYWFPCGLKSPVKHIIQPVMNLVLLSWVHKLLWKDIKDWTREVRGWWKVVTLFESLGHENISVFKSFCDSCPLCSCITITVVKSLATYTPNWFRPELFRSIEGSLIGWAVWRQCSSQWRQCI